MDQVVVPQHPFEEMWEQAYKRYKRTIRTFARNFKSQLPNLDMSDIEQELMIVLWRCVKNYRPDRGASFNTLFQGCARNQCISLVRSTNTRSRQGITVSLSEEEVIRAVNDVFDHLGNNHSAEDVALDRMEIREYVSEHGPEALLNGRRGRRSA